MRRRLIIGAVMVMTVCGWYAAYRTVRLTITIASELDRANDLTSIGPRAQSTIVIDRRGRPAFAFYSEQRIDVPIDQVSRHMVHAIVAVEDRRFYSHYGLDPIRIVGAALSNVRAGRILEGGSTITQQLARAVRLSPARTFERKVREAMLALRLEERYSKAQILQEYLNTVYFGEGFYGVEAASRGYFAKPASELAPAEAALLAALVRAPSRDAPCVSVERAMGRRNLVLGRMRKQGRISEAELSAGLRAPLPSRSHDHGSLLRASGDPGGEYFQEEIRRQLVSMFGSERVLRGGLRVYSTYDPVLQRAAEQAIRARVAEIAKARPRAKDLQGSLVAIDPMNGDVLALVGGRNYQESPFNRATQARRQAGSAFKPIIYAAALERGYAPGSVLRDLDTPIYSSRGASGESWLPDGEHENSEYTLRRALKVSSNRASAQLLQRVGVRTAVYYAHRLGIASDLPMVPSLALGTGEVTLLELTAAYGVFANQGLLATPRFLTRVEDADGTVIWSAPIETTRAISQTTAFLMSSMLADVVSSGTATGVRAAGFTLPAGGKTGTTDDYADAWFVGYTPHLVAGVWFGLDTPAPIMNRGFASVVAVPAWARFMKAATTGAKPDWYEVPADVERVAICRLTGARATDGCRHTIEEGADVHAAVLTGPSPESWPIPVNPLPSEPAEPNVYEDYFRLGTISAELCPLHSAVAETVSGTSGVVPASYPSQPIVIERALRSDGTAAITVKAGGR
jgi:1A family penicillin-binding protein